MKELKQKLSEALSIEGTVNDKLQRVCNVLDQNLEHFNWTGFYFKDGDKDELVLGPFTGAPTEHIRIPFGVGICGQVAVSGKPFKVADVYAQDNYLACSIDTKAELVVPIFKNGQNIGQIDIDSHRKNSFTDEDTELLEWLANKIAEIY